MERLKFKWIRFKLIPPLLLGLQEGRNEEEESVATKFARIYCSVILHPNKIDKKRRIESINNKVIPISNAQLCSKQSYLCYNDKRPHLESSHVGEGF